MDPVTFILFTHWILTRRFSGDLELNASTLLDVESLAKLWVFGEKYEIPLLQNTVIDALSEKWMDHTTVLTLPLIDSIYDSTSNGSPLRRTIEDAIALMPMDPRVCYSTGRGRRPNLRDQPGLVKMVLKMERLGNQEQKARDKWLVEQRCQRHVHETGVVCETSATEDRELEGRYAEGMSRVFEKALEEIFEKLAGGDEQADDAGVEQELLLPLPSFTSAQSSHATSEHHAQSTTQQDEILRIDASLADTFYDSLRLNPDESPGEAPETEDKIDPKKPTCTTTDLMRRRELDQAKVYMKDLNLEPETGMAKERLKAMDRNLALMDAEQLRAKMEKMKAQTMKMLGGAFGVELTDEEMEELMKPCTVAGSR